jgi:hypothetical protein
MADDLLTIRDLADRWGVSVDKAKKHVRKNLVPFIQIGAVASVNISWGLVRFKADAVKRWEDENQRVFDVNIPEPKPKIASGGGKYKHVKMR